MIESNTLRTLFDEYQDPKHFMIDYNAIINPELAYTKVQFIPSVSDKDQGSAFLTLLKDKTKPTQEEWYQALDMELRNRWEMGAKRFNGVLEVYKSIMYLCWRLPEDLELNTKIIDLIPNDKLFRPRNKLKFCSRLFRYKLNWELLNMTLWECVLKYRRLIIGNQIELYNKTGGQDVV